MMKYELKNVNGMVKGMLRTGNDFTLNSFGLASAQQIVSTGKLVESDVEGYPICIDHTWYFEGEAVKATTKKGTKENEAVL